MEIRNNNSINYNPPNIISREINAQNNQNAINSSRNTRMQIQEAIACNIAKAGGIEDKYDLIICQAAQKYNIDPNLIKSIIKKESSFNPKANSKVGAKGLMQLTDQTSQYLGVKKPFDPEQNIMGGTRYISKLIDKFDGKLELALAAYNSGPARVKKYNDIPPFRETQTYVRKVIEFYENYKNSG
ncbi:MAG: lytic transglycosylase domain-containing protein [bacterium]|nr:lytic transglycosylase domain-containing protein [bacterium]